MADPDMCLKIKALGKYSEGWWTFTSKQPAISTGLFDSSKKAEKAYEERLKAFLQANWNISPDCVYLYESKIKCNDAYFQDPEDHNSVRVAPEDIRISLTYCIQESQNHTLDEFITDREKTALLECSSLKHAEKVVEVLNKINDLSKETGLTPETVFNYAISELHRQKEVGETA